MRVGKSSRGLRLDRLQVTWSPSDLLGRRAIAGLLVKGGQVSGATVAAFDRAGSTCNRSWLTRMRTN